MNQEQGNPLGIEPVGTLLRKFAVPSVVSMLVMSLYNIVDQFFIGRSVGTLGNAATNVAFPMTTMCIAVALAFGIGGSSGFNLNMGKGEKNKAMYYVGNSIVMMFSLGVIIAAICQLFMQPMLVFFGAPNDVLPYAKDYVSVLSFGFPFAILGAGGAHLVRADGSPRYSMVTNLSGALINTVLDYLFVMVFGWGMKGAAFATIIGQFATFVFAIVYFTRFKASKIEIKHLIPNLEIVAKTFHLGMAQCLNQIAIMAVQIVINKSFKHYGALSVYGESVPLAAAGIIMKVNQIYFSFCIGISQGIQPIASFNRGAGNYERVRKAYRLAITCATVVSVIAFVIFQTLPLQIISLFGKGTPEYYDFAVRFFKVFLFMTFINGIQPITSTFCTAIGEPNKGTFLSLTRQILFLMPLLIIMPIIFTYVKGPENGIIGLIYTAPISDFLAAVVSIIVIRKVFKTMSSKKLNL